MTSLLTIAQAAERLQVSPSTVRRLINRKELRVCRFGGSIVRVPVEATHKMADVGTEARWQSAVRDANNVREIWRAMLAASPYNTKETK